MAASGHTVRVPTRRQSSAVRRLCMVSLTGLGTSGTVTITLLITMISLLGVLFILLSHIPDIAIVSYTCNMPQRDIGNYLPCFGPRAVTSSKSSGEDAKQLGIQRHGVEKTMLLKFYILRVTVFKYKGSTQNHNYDSCHGKPASLGLGTWTIGDITVLGMGA